MAITELLASAAIDFLASKGLNTLLLADLLDGEAKEVGEAIAKLAIESVACMGNSRSLGIVAGGETTVTIRGKGVGGRNQEIALSAALNLKESEECVIASFSTDGVDGPTDAAGAIIDGYTLKRARQLGLDPEKFISNNDSNSFFSKLDDLIYTGATETNVNDLCVIIALKD